MKRRKLHVRKSSTSGPRGVSWETACPQSVGFCCNLNVFLKCRSLAPVVCWFELLPEMSRQVHLRVSWDLRAHTHAHVSASVQPSGLLLWLSSLMTLQDLGNQSLQGKLKPCLCSVPFHLITSWTQAAHREEAGWPGGHLSPVWVSLSGLYSWWPQGREALSPVTPALLWASGVWCL